jgi:long-chain acyl-CoA synthetase
MYPGKHAVSRAEQPAFVMAETGERVTYAGLERRSNRLAHLLRAWGLRRLDHYAIFMENNARYVECCAAGIRSGLYLTCVNSYLTVEELAYIVDNSQSKILISSMARRAVALAALEKCPRIELCLLVGTGRRQTRPRPRRGGLALPRHAYCRRGAGHCHALFFRHDRSTKGCAETSA